RSTRRRYAPSTTARSCRSSAHSPRAISSSRQRSRMAVGLADDANVLGARSLRAAALVVAHPLSLAEVREPDALDGAHVEEHVCSRAIVDETKTLVGQTLDRTFSHLRFSVILVVSRRAKEAGPYLVSTNALVCAADRRRCRAI